MGVTLAKGELIVTTDADCTMQPDWLQTISDGFQSNINMLIGAVRFRDTNNFFQRLQSMEFASVIGTGIASCMLGYPTMCNGANLAFRKKAFEEVKGYSGNEHIASGDDEFLMRKIIQRFPSSIGVMPLNNVVVTSSSESLKDLLSQRLRWASKWKSNSSRGAKMLGVFMLLIQASWIGVIAAEIFSPSFVLSTILFWKVCVDVLFLWTVCTSLGIPFRIHHFAVLQFLYPVYVLYVGVLSQLKNHQWKGREAQ
jgi:cellulose synthase/poly-beta-1,6-N-acetylglucosamine synthase-like glycosyltransferase